MADDVFLILHGWGGNKPAHWQEHLVGKLQAAGKRVFYPKMPSPTAPILADWQQGLEAALAEVAQQAPDAPLTVLTHSLGSINWIHYTATHNTHGRQIADRVLLIAPPYIVPQIPPIDVPETVTQFFPPPVNPQALKAAARQTVLIASDTDDYATYDQSCGYAQLLEIPIHKLPGAGHISPYYGYGEWPWVLEWCLRQADLPPVPRPAG